MKRLLVVLFFTMLGVTYGEEFRIPDLASGMHSYPSANKIPDNAAAVIENFYTDSESIAIERNGFEKRDTTTLGNPSSVTGLWEFVDNTGRQWIISYSSKTYYYNEVGGTPTRLATTTVTTPPDCAPNLGKIWCVNGTDTGWSFDGSTRAVVSGMPLGTLIEPWRTRLVIGNVTGAQSTLRFSADGDGTSWTLGGNPTDPFAVLIGGANDGFPITCLWGSYLDNLVAARKRDTWFGSGFDQADFELRNVSREIGCIQTGSMREFDGSLLMMSSRGMEELRGYTFTHISEPIRNITDTIVKNTAGSRNNTQTSEGDFSSGSISPTGNLSATIVSGSVVLSSFNFTDTLQADFLQGTFSNVEIATFNVNSVWISTVNHPLFDTSNAWGLESASSYWTSAAAFPYIVQPITAGLTTVHCGTIGARTGSGYILLSDRNGGAYPAGTSDLLVEVVDSVNTNTALYGTTITFTPSTCSHALQTLSISSLGLSRRSIRLRFSLTGVDPTSTYVLSNPFVASGENVTFYLAMDTSSSDLEKNFFVDDLAGGYSVSTGTYTSKSYDTGRTATIVSVSSVGLTTSEYRPSITLQTSTNNSTWRSLTSGVLPSTIPVSFVGDRYFRTISSFTVQGSSDAYSTLDNVTVTAVSTGGFISQIVDTGGQISAWGPVTIADQQSGGSITYQFNASTNSSLSLFISTGWATITSGGIPTHAAHRYAAFRSSFSATVATANVSLDSFQMTWSEGGGTPPIASWNYDRRYWLAYTTSTASSPYNDRVLVYQRNRTWTLLTGINAASFTTWRDNLYFGNSIGNGYVYKFDVGASDDGTSITSRIVTKSYDLGLPTQNKDFQNLYTTYLGNATSFTGTFSMTYDLDQLGQTFTLGSASLLEGTGQIAAKFPFPLSNPVQGREIQYSLLKSGTGNRLKLYGLKTVFSIHEDN